MAKASIRGAMDMELGGEGRRHKRGIFHIFKIKK
jgi:hypothetical protein